MGGQLKEAENERALKQLLIETIGSFTFRASGSDIPHLADKIIAVMKSNEFAFLTQHQIASYQVKMTRLADKGWQEKNEVDSSYTKFVNDLLETACESCWDGEESAEQIALNYVHYLEKTGNKHKEGCYYADDAS